METALLPLLLPFFRHDHGKLFDLKLKSSSLPNPIRPKLTLLLPTKKAPLNLKDK